MRTKVSCINKFLKNNYYWMELNIGIDLDDVIADLISGLIDSYNNKYHVKITREDIHGWDFFPQELYEEFRSNGGYKRLGLIPNARNLLSWLRRIGKVSIITWRSRDYREDTFFWLEKNLNGLYKRENVHFAGGSKLDLCRELRINLLIDDSVKHTKQVVENLGIYAILCNNGTPMYRNTEEHPRIYKAENIDEVKKYVLEVKSILSHSFNII